MQVFFLIILKRLTLEYAKFERFGVSLFYISEENHTGGGDSIVT